MDRGGRQWRRIRLVVLHRDNYRCRHCGAAGRLQVDHIKPLHLRGAQFDLNNLQSLCVRCHNQKTLLENPKAQVKGRREWLQYLKSV